MAKLLNKVIQSFGNILQKCCSERPVTKKFSNLTQADDILLCCKNAKLRHHFHANDPKVSCHDIQV